MQTFTALRVHKVDQKIVGRYDRISVADLAHGELLVKVQYSGINYKDALAITGKGKIMKYFPMVAGIDVAGVVVRSDDPRFKEGDHVITCGSGFGEDYDGGFSEYTKVKAEYAVPLPAGMDARTAMAIGTAGFTAALAIVQMEHNRQQPDLGPIAVTGPTGGVGGIAIDLLASKGYQVTAITRKTGAEDFLTALGATDVLTSDALNIGEKPLEKAQWGGVIDNVGGELLSKLCRSTVYGGNVAAIGLAASHELHCSVMPFILRGVNLLGINSVYPPHALRLQTWQQLATDMQPRRLAALVTREVPFMDALPEFERFVQGRNTGRTLITFS